LKKTKATKLILILILLSEPAVIVVVVVVVVVVVLRAEVSERDTAVFLVKGLSIGQTTVSAVVVDKAGKKIASAPQQIEVGSSLDAFLHLHLQ